MDIKRFLNKARQGLAALLSNLDLRHVSNRPIVLPSENNRSGRCFGRDEIRLLKKVIASGALNASQGTQVSLLEREFCELYGVNHCVATSSGTAAMHAALAALDVKPGDEIITTPVTDVGAVLPIMHENCTPVFADVDPYTLNVTAETIARRITERTKVIIVTHLLGGPCDMDSIMSLAQAHMLPVIEDCAQAYLAGYRGRKVGTIGSIGIFSMQQTKHLAAGEGGLLITNSSELGERARSFINKAWNNAERNPGDYFLGLNYRLSELQGAVARAQLRRLPLVVQKRRQVASCLRGRLRRLPGIRLPQFSEKSIHAYFRYMVHVDEGIIGCDAHVLSGKLIGAGVDMPPKYVFKPLLATKTFEWSGEYPNLYAVRNSTLVLPINERYTKRHVHFIADALEKAMSEPSKIAHKKYPDKKLRFGLIGCGRVAALHARALLDHPHTELKLVHDLDVSRSKRFAERWGTSPARHVENLIKDRSIDAVLICTPPAVHASLIRLNILGGKHVLCEKPFTVSSKDGGEIKRLCQTYGKAVMATSIPRFFHNVITARELLTSDAIGTVDSAEFIWINAENAKRAWRSDKQISGGGVLMDLGAHVVDTIRFLLGPIEEIYVRFAQPFQNLVVEDHAQFNFKTENRVMGTAHIGWILTGEPRIEIVIRGSEGFIKIKRDQLFIQSGKQRPEREIRIVSSERDAYVRQLEYFRKLTRAGELKILKALDNACETVRIVEACYASQRENKWLRVDESSGASPALRAILAESQTAGADIGI